MKKYDLVFLDSYDIEKLLNFLERKEFLCPYMGEKRGECPQQRCIEEIEKEGHCTCKFFFTPKRYKKEKQMIESLKGTKHCLHSNTYPLLFLYCQLEIKS